MKAFLLTAHYVNVYLPR